MALRESFTISLGANLSDKISYYLGIDGGGSKTKAALVSKVLQADGLERNHCQCLLGEGVVSGSNPLTVGWDVAFDRIAESVKLAKEAAGISEANLVIEKAIFAIAGTANPEAKQHLTTWVDKQRFANQSEVVSDVAPLLANVPKSVPAIGVIAGTGSVVLLHDGAGHASTVGGWGYLIDDVGSGYSIGKRALREVVRSIDRDEKKEPLTSALLQALSIDSGDGLKQAIYNVSDPQQTIASVAKVIIQLAERDDPTSIRLLEVEASLLANEIGIGWDRLRSENKSVENFVLYVGGSLLQKSRFYRRLLANAVKQQGLPMEAIRLAPDGACGCALLASRC